MRTVNLIQTSTLKKVKAFCNALIRKGARIINIDAVGSMGARDIWFEHDNASDDEWLAEFREEMSKEFGEEGK